MLYNGSNDAARAYSKDVLAKARKWDAILAGAPGAKIVAAADRVVRRGDHGPRVERITKRLAFVHSSKTGAAYLDAPRKRFDQAAVAALKAFQREHGLVDDGVFGDESARKLTRAVKAEKLRRSQGGTVAKPAKKKTTTTVGPAAKPSVRVAQLPALVHEVRHLDAETGEAWEELVEYCRRRARLLVRIQSGKGSSEAEIVKGLHEMTEILLRIEGKLGHLAEIEEREEAAEEHAAAAVAKEAAALVEKTAALASKTATTVSAKGSTATVEVSKLDEIQPPPPEGPAPLPPGGIPKAKPALRRLSDLTDDELLNRIARLDRALGKSRDELIGRYAKNEAGDRPAAAAARAHRHARRAPPRARPGRRRSATARRPPGRPPIVRPDGKVVAKDDPQGGKVVVTKIGDRGVLVRRSKVALARVPRAARATPSTSSCAARCAARPAAPKKAGLATAHWRQAVKAAQHLSARSRDRRAGRRAGEDPQPYWPRDNAGKRVPARHAGRVADDPGQLTPNFNIKEFACKDAAHTQ